MMKILIITNKRDITSDFIVKELKNRKIEFYRFNTEELNNTCSVNFDFHKNKFNLFDKIFQREYDLKSFTSVYFRRPEIPEFTNHNLDENEKQFLKNESFYTLEGIYKIVDKLFWLNPIYSIREAENKIYQLELAKSIGFQIPNSIITNSYSNAIRFYDDMNGECIIKPVKSGLVGNKADAKIIFTTKLKNRPSFKNQIETSPIYFQKLIKKKYDVRVIIVGNKVFSTLIHSQEINETKLDWRQGENILKHSKTTLPKEITDKCFKLLDKLGLNYGALDFILDENENFIFLEINPNGQWAWIEQRTGYQISNEIVNLLENGKS